MLRYATLSELAGRGGRLLEQDGSVLAKDMDASVRGSTFLSHSSKDAARYVAGAIGILKDHGASVYLDKKDPSLPPHTSMKTAEALKDRIRASNRFVLFATKQSSGSRWVPWGLGLADGLRTPTNVAVFPGAENAENTEWADEEYLGAYNRIVYGDLKGQNCKVWMVLDAAASTAVELSR